MESHEAGFPPFPHPLEIPAGVPTLPGYGDDYHVFEDRQSPPKTRNQSHSHRKGLVNHVPGLKRNACPGTLSYSAHFQDWWYVERIRIPHPRNWWNPTTWFRANDSKGVTHKAEVSADRVGKA